MVRDVGRRRGPRAGGARRGARAVARAGVPDNPGAWLMATAKHRAIDRLRRARGARAQDAGARPEIEIRGAGREPDLEAGLDDPFGDDLLRLIFTACHPVLSTRGARRAHAAPARRADDRGDRARVPGRRADDRAADRAREAHARGGARAVRGAARATSSPRASPRCSRSIYLDLQRGLRGDRRRRLGCGPSYRGGAAARPHPRRAAPGEPEVHGLVALMEIQASRSARAHRPRRRAGTAARPGPRALGPAAHRPRARGARRAPSSRRRRWGRTRCRRRSPPATRARGSPATRTGSASSRSTTGSPSSRPRRSSSSTARSPSAWRSGPGRALALVDALAAEPALAGYHLLPSVRGDLLAKLGRDDEARAEFDRAASLTQNARERALLLARMAACSPRNGR